MTRLFMLRVPDKVLYPGFLVCHDETIYILLQITLVIPLMNVVSAHFSTGFDFISIENFALL